jgi:hypothetical protein
LDHKFQCRGNEHMKSSTPEISWPAMKKSIHNTSG